MQPWALLRTPLRSLGHFSPRAGLSDAPLTPSPQIGEIKRGTLVGTDDGGNRYYENLDYKVNMTRWVEYKDIHNYDASSVPPRWHGWLHYVSDAPGNHEDQAEFIARGVENIEQLDQGTSHQPCVAPLPCASVRPGRPSPSPSPLPLSLSHRYTTHVGLTDYVDEPVHNKTLLRPRGFGIGSASGGLADGDEGPLKFVPGQEENHYKQPGHPMHNATNAPFATANHKGRFTKTKSMGSWDPSDPAGANRPKPIRSLDEN